MKIKILFLLLATIFFNTNLYAQDLGINPIETRGSTIFQISSSELLVPTRLYTNENEIVISQYVVWSNTFNLHNNFILDHEILKIDYKIWYGITDRLQIGVSLPVNIISGGKMDRFIEGFHESFGLNNDREDYDKNDFTIGNDKLESEYYLNDITLHARYRFLDNPGISCGLRLQTPSLTSNDLFNHTQFGFGVDTAVFYNIGNMSFVNSFNIALVGDTEIYGFEVEPIQFSYVAYVNWQFLDDISATIQFTTTSKQLDYLSYNNLSYEVTGGFRINIGEYYIDLGIIENIITHNNSIDVGFYFGITFKK